MGNEGGLCPARNAERRRPTRILNAASAAGAASFDLPPTCLALPVSPLLVCCAVPCAGRIGFALVHRAQQCADRLDLLPGQLGTLRTARHLRSRTRSASEKYGSSNSSPSDSSVPALSGSSAAVDHLLPAQLPVATTSPTAGAGEMPTAQRRRANATDGPPDHPNGLSTSHELDDAVSGSHSRDRSTTNLSVHE
jgi:hypothetical protein